MQRVCRLCLEIQRSSSGIIIRSLSRNEESRNWDVNASRRRSCHLFSLTDSCAAGKSECKMRKLRLTLGVTEVQMEYIRFYHFRNVTNNSYLARSWRFHRSGERAPGGKCHGASLEPVSGVMPVVGTSSTRNESVG